jgi:hypothetical protein
MTLLEFYKLILDYKEYFSDPWKRPPNIINFQIENYKELEEESGLPIDRGFRFDMGKKYSLEFTDFDIFNAPWSNNELPILCEIRFRKLNLPIPITGLQSLENRIYCNFHITGINLITNGENTIGSVYVKTIITKKVVLHVKNVSFN